MHRTDVAAAYRLVLEKGERGAHVNVAAESGVTVARLAAAIARRFGMHADHRVRPPADVLAEHGGWAEGPMLGQRLSSSRIRLELGWTPRHGDACPLLERGL